MATILKNISDAALSALALPAIFLALAVLAVGLYVRTVLLLVAALGEGLPDRWTVAVAGRRLGGRVT